MRDPGTRTTLATEQTIGLTIVTHNRTHNRHVTETPVEYGTRIPCWGDRLTPPTLETSLEMFLNYQLS